MQTRIAIGNDMDAKRAVIEAGRIAAQAGLDATAANMVATATSELVQNILKYAGRGMVTLSPVERAARRGVEVEARDQGPGIADLDAALTDHFSSGGTLGLGLPGVRRLMDEFEIENLPGRGLRVVACKWS